MATESAAWRSLLCQTWRRVAETATESEHGHGTRKHSIVVAETMNSYYPPHTPSPACYRHPDRPTALGCTRCGRPICPECMLSAPVGQQCVDCVQAAGAAVPAASAPAARGPKPWVTYGLIAVNVLVFVLQQLRPELRGQFSLWPPAVAGGDYYRLVTSAFMHYGLMHLAFNMWALYVLGPPLEEHLGRVRFAVLYGWSALGGSALVYLLSPVNAATAGASGAIYGLFGATFVAAKRLHLDVRWLVTLIVINLAMTFSIPGISWQGHIGGLVTGALVAAVFVYAPRPQQTIVQTGAMAALLGLFIAVIAWRTTQLIDLYGPALTRAGRG